MGDIDVFNGGQILSYEFRGMLQSNKVKAVKGSIDKYTKDGVILTDGTKVQADLVVYGTGFTKHYNYLDRLLQQKLNLQKDGLYLYRNIIPTGLPDLAFVGCEVST